MKLLPILLINVVTVAAGIVVYDQIRDPGPRTVYEESGAADSSVLARLEALESARADQTPMLQAKGADPRVLARLEDLEKRVGSMGHGGGAPGAENDSSANPSPSGDPLAAPPVTGSASDEPTDAEVEHHMKVAARARELEREKRDERRIDEALATLEINLSDKQKKQLYEANKEFGKRRQEIYSAAFTKMREARARGEDVDMREVWSSSRQTAQDEFVLKISNFIPEVDAQRISESLNSRGGGMRGRPPMMGGGRTRGR